MTPHLLLAVVTLLAPQDPGTDPARMLTGVEKTAHFEIRFRPGSRAEASVDRVAALVEGDLERILKELGLRRFPHTIRLFLYDDVAELQRITGVPSGGHSVPLESHVPHDNDQTRVHELVHVVAEKFTEKGDEPRSLFFAEGLANAVLRFVHGVSVDAVAAFYKRRGELPSLAELHEVTDFYAWLQQHPGFNGYDVAGSYLRYLLDEYDARAVRRYYCGWPAKKAFGVELGTIEKGWHARLHAVVLRPGLVKLLRERAGGETASEANPAEAALGEAVLGPAEEWRDLARSPVADGDPGRWEKAGDADVLVLTGKPSEGDWCSARFPEQKLADAIVRCRAEPLAGCYGVKIQIGLDCQALLLRGQGTFVYTERGGVGHDGRTQLGDAAVEIVLRRRAGRASIWIDGALVVEAPVGGDAATLAVGCVGGPARFSAIAARRLE